MVQPSSDESVGMSGGVIAGIVAASSGVVIISGIGIYFKLIKKLNLSSLLKSSSNKVAPMDSQIVQAKSRPDPPLELSTPGSKDIFIEDLTIQKDLPNT